MIRKADDTMRNDLLEWLRMDEPSNLTVIGSMLRHNLSADTYEAWVQSDEKGKWTAFIQNLDGHYTLCIPKSRGDMEENGLFCSDAEEPVLSGGDMEEIGLFLRFADPLSVSGTGSIIRKVQPVPDGFSEEVSVRMILDDGNHLRMQPTHEEAIGSGFSEGRASMDDAEGIGRLIFETEAFQQHYHSAAEVADGVRAGILSGKTRHIVMRLNGHIISHVCTTVETNGYALVSGVVTRNDARRQGHAARLVSCLCRQLLAEGRHPCLFCKSPAARAMYRVLGFSECGEYITLRKTS
jgi:hypothetical protein